MAKTIRRRSYDADEIFKQAVRFNFAAEILARKMYIDTRTYLQAKAKTQEPSKVQTQEDAGFYTDYIPRGMMEIPTGEVMATCHALAIELYLKACCQFRNGSFLETHQFHLLYDDLPAADHIWAEEMYSFHRADPIATAAKMTKPDPTDVRTAFEELSNSFIEWRYAFEGAVSEGSLSLLQETMKTLALNINPAWETFGQGTPDCWVAPFHPPQAAPDQVVRTRTPLADGWVRHTTHYPRPGNKQKDAET